jgi:hypothetical protein
MGMEYLDVSGVLSGWDRSTAAVRIRTWMGVGVLSAGLPGWKWTTWIGMDYLDRNGVLG